jgi:hypothetical protein
MACAWYWNSELLDAAPLPPGARPEAGQVLDKGISPPTPQTSSEPLDRERRDNLVEYRVERSETGFDEFCGLATADFRLRRSVVIPAGVDDAVIAWDRSLGEAALLFSDRRPPLVLGRGATSLRLRDLSENVIAIKPAEVGGCELITHSVTPADWVFTVAESKQSPDLALMQVDPACRVRAVYRGVGMVSGWSGGKESTELSPRYPAVVVRVEAPDGRPVASAVVLAIDEAGRVRDRGVTDEGGSALLPVPDGWSRWVADRDGMVAGDSRELNGAKIVLGHARSIDIVLSVQGEGPVERGRVTWRGLLERSALVESGHACLRDVPVDPVKLMLADGGLLAETEVPRKLAKYVWEIETSSTLSGVVEGIPAELGTTFVFLKGAGVRAPARLGPMGTFQFHNVPTRMLELEVQIRTPDGVERILKIHQAHPREYARIVVAALDLPSGSLRLQLRPYGGGENPPGLGPVALIEAGGRRRFSGSVVDGVCEIRWIPAGSYECQVSVPGWHLPYGEQIEIQPSGVSSFYWELPEAISCYMTIEGKAINATSCRLGFRRTSQDEWILIPRDLEQPRWDLGPVVHGSYEFAWFGDGVAPRMQSFVVDPKQVGAWSMPQQQATKVTLLVEGLRSVKQGSIILRQDSKAIVQRQGGGDWSRLEFDLYPGSFSWELATEHKSGTGVLEVLPGGGDYMLYCR